MNETTRIAVRPGVTPHPRPFLQLVSVQDHIISEDAPSDDPSKSAMVIVFGFMVLACVLVGALIGWLA